MGASSGVAPLGASAEEEEDAFAPSWSTATSGVADPRDDAETPRQRPGYLNEIDRWSAHWDWRERAVAWDEHLQAGREQADAEFAAL